MAIISETGHKKNVANFEDLIAFCTSYAEKYKPSNPDLTLEALNSKHTEALNALELVNQKLAVHINALEARQTAFKPLTSIVNKIVYASKAAALPDLIIADIGTIVRKLKGMRKTPKSDPTPQPDAEPHKYISVSQVGFDDRIENFSKLIELLRIQPAYRPNEEELSISGLTTLLERMKSSNIDAINASVPLSNVRIERNKILYDGKTGLVMRGKTVKSYIKSIFGPSSPEYMQVSKLRFINAHL